MPVPEENSDHVVLASGFHSVNDLISALQDANVLPRRVPVDGGFGEHAQPIERFDLKFVVRYKLEFDTFRLDAYTDADAPGMNAIRLGVPLRVGALEVALVELSTERVLNTFQFALSGRAFVYGSIVTDPVNKTPNFVISKLPEFRLDDQADRIPPPFDKRSFERLIERSINRDVRARSSLPSLPGVTSFPISFQVNDLVSARPVSYGIRLDEIDRREDPLSTAICLPGAVGNPACVPGQPVERDFYRFLEFYLRVRTDSDPVPPVRTGREVQVDIGHRVIQGEISKDNGWEDWKEIAAKMFRFRTGQWTDWKQRTDGTGSVTARFRAQLQVAYPKIKWCKGWTKTPFGKIKYKYPCGIERGWHGVKKVNASIEFRLAMNGSRACIEILDKRVRGQNDVLGFLITAAYAVIGSAILGALLSVVSVIVGGTVAAIALASVAFVLIVLASIDKIIGLVLNFLPNGVCADLSELLHLPVFDSKLEVEFQHGFIDFTRNGITIATTPDFTSRALIRHE